MLKYFVKRDLLNIEAIKKFRREIKAKHIFNLKIFVLSRNFTAE